MSENCGECKKNFRKNDLYIVKYNCGHELKTCIDCNDINDKEELCFECRKVICYKCNRGTDKNKTSEYKRVIFQNCLTKDHSLNVCKQCFQEGYQKLVVGDSLSPKEDQQSRHCYLCTTNISKNDLLSYNYDLDCKGKHKIVICVKCNQLFQKIKKKCPKCEPFQIETEFCFACYQPTDEKVAILPIACNIPEHKYTICINCASSLSSPKMVCRFCDAKPKEQYFFCQTIETETEELCAPVVRFVSNRIDPHSIEIDRFLCPTCHPISAILKPILNENTNGLNRKNSFSVQEEDGVWFNAFASATKFGDNLMVTGGLDPGADTDTDPDTQKNLSTDSCSVVKFIQDGRSFGFLHQPYPCKLNKRRHGHQSFYDNKEKTIYVIGGAQKTSPNKISFLDSIECLSVVDTTINFEENETWNHLEAKLKVKRSSFAICSIGRKLYLFGGFSGLNLREETIEVLDLETKTLQLLPLASGFKIPIYPVLIPQTDKEVLLLGGFTSEGNKNEESFKLNIETGKFSKHTFSGINTSDRMHQIFAFGESIIFGGNCFDSSSNQNSARLKSLTTGYEAPISGGFKNLKTSSKDSMKSLLDCFPSSQFQFVFNNHLGN